MKNYLFKFDEPYEKGCNDIFAKGCIKKNDNFLPVFLNFNPAEKTGKARLDFDEIGVFNKDAVVGQSTLRIGFVVEQCRFENGIRIIEKCEVLELSIGGGHLLHKDVDANYES